LPNFKNQRQAKDRSARKYIFFVNLTLRIPTCYKLRLAKGASVLRVKGFRFLLKVVHVALLMPAVLHAGYLTDFDNPIRARFDCGNNLGSLGQSRNENRKYPQGTLPYSMRPSIGQIRKAQWKGAPENWRRTLLGLARFVTSLEFFPEDFQFYFLARDMESGFDLAQLIYAVDSSIGKRIHLLPISKTSLRDPNLSAYLKNTDFEEHARAGRVLILDTGFRGTIPDALRDLLPSDASIDALHLLSSNRRYPSSRVFLTTLDPKYLNASASMLENDLVLFEEIPHYTHSTTHYEIENFIWEAMTSPVYEVGSFGSLLMGSVNSYSNVPVPKTVAEPEEAKRVMADIRLFFEDPSVKSEIERWRSSWRDLSEISRDENSADSEKITTRIRLMNVSLPLEKAIAKDFASLVSKVDPHSHVTLNVLVK
jgi:hypothetical protein